MKLLYRENRRIVFAVRFSLDGVHLWESALRRLLTEVSCCLCRACPICLVAICAIIAGSITSTIFDSKLITAYRSWFPAEVHDLRV